MFSMRGSVHGPGGKLLELDLLITNLNSMKRKRKEAMKEIEKGL